MKRARARDGRRKKPKTDFWSIPKMWEGETVFVVGGGPSLMGFNFKRLEGQRIVGINLAFTSMPFSQFCFFADNRFWKWHEAELMAYKGHVISTAASIKPPHPHFHRIERDHDQSKWFSTKPDIVVGKDSGVQAINFAFHLGAARIVMLGFDMGFKDLTEEEKQDKIIKGLQQPHIPRAAKQRPNVASENHLAHWYKEHPIPSREQNYKTRFLPQYSQVVKIIHEAGREIFLATPSAINCIPQIDLDLTIGETHGSASVGINQRQAALPVRELHSWAAPTWLRSNSDGKAHRQNDQVQG